MSSLMQARRIIVQNWHHITMVFILTMVAFGLRAHQYWVVPLSDETADELAWTWLGASLLQDGQPTSWSYFSQYEPNFIYQRGIVEAPLVRPAVDHPPLFSIIPGALHSITSEEWQTIPSRKVIRFPMIFLGTLNVILLYLVARRSYDAQWAVLTIAIYATVPLFVLSSRLVVAENLLITWMLAAILIVDAVLNQKIQHKRMWEVILITVCILTVFTKISGIVLPISIIVLAFWKQEYRLLRTGLLSLGISIIILLLYMATIHLPLFLSVQLGQASRTLGLTTLFSRFFIHPVVAKLYYLDGWLTTGLMSAVLWLSTNNRSESNTLLFAKILFIISIGFIATTVEEFSYHGWYNYILFPFFALSLTQLSKKLLQGSPILMILVWILCLPTVQLIITQLQLRDQLSNILIRILYGIGSLPLLAQSLQQPKVTKSLTIALFAVLLLANCLAVLTVSEVSIRENNNYHFFVLPR